MTSFKFLATIVFAAQLAVPSSALSQKDVSTGLSAQAQDSILRMVELLPATVAAIQSPDRAPFASQTITSTELSKRDGSMDLPYLLRFTPSLVVTSDAGAGVGYTSMRIRGSDQTHINVTINGVTLNDAESHQVYWVDLPDLSSSIDELEIQRGVGSSSNGPGAFGATVSLNTMQFDSEPGGKMIIGGGSFGTLRSMVKWSTGQLGSGFFIEGRASRILSQGYLDRSSSDLSSLQLGLGYRWETGHLAYSAMLGHERTQQAWYGVPRVGLTGDSAAITEWAANSSEYGYGSDVARIADLIERGRQHNYYRYEDQVDDYQQDHHQLHFSQTFANWDVGSTIHYTKGGGYFEQFKAEDDLALYGAGPLGLADSTIATGDVIRRRWLDNDFYGMLMQASRDWDKVSLQLGAGAFNYQGGHYGVPIWMQYGASGLLPTDRYYDNTGEKQDRYAFSAISSNAFQGRMRWRGELQARQVSYNVQGVDSDLRNLEVDTAMLFFNPKFGADWILNDDNRFFFSVARGSREPVRNDFIDRAEAAYPKAETLTDLEMGWVHQTTHWGIEAVAYQMNYENQLVLTGALNDVGSAVRMNVDASQRTGLELSLNWRPGGGFTWYGTATRSINTIDDFDETLSDYGNDEAPVLLVSHQNTDISFSPAIMGSSVATLEFWSRTQSTHSTSASLEWSARFVGKQYLDNTSNENRALPSYGVNDLRLRWIRERKNSGDIAFSAHFRNILNTQYSANGWTYSYLNGGIAAMTTEVYLFPQAGAHGMLSLEINF
jgi:iron complex outermembrane receptor protein